LNSGSRSVCLFLIAAGCAAALPSIWGGPVGYAAPSVLASVDTTRPKGSPSTDSGWLERGWVIPGYLSSWGLPPLPGQFSLTDTGLVFRSAVGDLSARAATISLAYIDDENGRAHYIFRIDTGVFETDAPGPLLDATAHPMGVDSGSPSGAPPVRRLVDGSDPAAPLRAARQIAASRYADSLYGLFGQPRAPLGLVGRRGRAAGRIGEYIASRDSLALDPSHMTCEAQLRHALAHELGHRWQVRAKAQLAALWAGVPAIRDPKRYGYADRSEHQAEAIAFAVSFLQTTAGSAAPAASSLGLLEHYELLVPGTRTLTRYLLLQPVYRTHPLRSLLTTDRIRYAREK
jgi:hypothetical protein